MFRLKPNHAPFPPLYEHVERQLPTVKDRGWDKVGNFTLREKRDFMPQPGLQENFLRCDSNIIFLCGAATMGKCQSVDSKVLTPFGFVRMGDLKVGNIISGADGGFQTVEEIFEQPEKELYRFIMADGTSVESSEDHLWVVRESRWKMSAQYVTKTTGEIIKDFERSKQPPKTGSPRNICFPVNGPVQFNPKGRLRIHPYLLGVLIGDGCLRLTGRRVGVSTPDSEIVDTIKGLGYNIYQTKSQRKIDFFISDVQLFNDLKEYGLIGKLSYEKYIPEDYLYASMEDRLALLHGLFDTDGSCSGSNIEYSTTSEKLAEQVAFLVRSLGYVCKVRSRVTHFTYKGAKKQGRTSYRVTVSTDDRTFLFSVGRKKDAFRFNAGHRGFVPMHYLKSIEKCGTSPCRCIRVSNPDHLYITDDFIVTHNTYSMLMKFLYGIDKPGFAGRFISMRLADSKKGTSIYRDAMELLGNYSNCEVSSSDSPTFAWSKWNSAIQLIHSNFNVENPTEWDDFKELAKKNQASLIQVDEGSDMPFKMFTYWMSRNRDSSGMKPQITMSFNPEYAHWTTTLLLLGGYIDPNTYYIKPEMNGRTRYIYFEGDDVSDIIFGNTAEEVAQAAGIVLSDADRKAGLTEADMVKSFTMFTGEAADNLKLVAATGGGSIANLHATGSTQRNILKGAYFGPVNNERSSVTKQMILDLPGNPISEDEGMYATMDISGAESNSDVCQMIIWKGLRIIAIEAYKGDMKQIVYWIEGMLGKYGVPMSNFAFDATGMGFFLKSYINANPITSNKTALQEYDENGNQVVFEQYFNIRSQLLGKTRVLFETGKISTSLDLNGLYQYGKKGAMRSLRDILFDEIDLFISTTKNKRIYYLSKEEYKSRHQKNSPDLMDSICLRAFFELDARPKKQPSPEIVDDAYDDIFTPYTSYGAGRSPGIVWVG